MAERTGQAGQIGQIGQTGKTEEPAERAAMVESSKPVQSGEARKSEQPGVHVAQGQAIRSAETAEMAEPAKPEEATGPTAPKEIAAVAGPDDTAPRIYVACLAAYNAGRLHGRWIDALQDADAIRDEIEAMLKTSPMPFAEDYAIHDYEGFEGARISEYCGTPDVAQLAAFIDEHGRLGAELYQYFGGDMDEAEAALEDHAGEFKSLGHFAEELTEECSDVPVHLALYLDYDAMARDMELNGDIFSIETGFECVHVFWAR